MFSGGIASWATARVVVGQHGPDAVTLLFADTRAEDPDLYRFVREAAAQLGAQLVTVADGRTPWEVFRDRRYIGNTRIAPCSVHLKQKPCRSWLAEHTDPADTTVYVGIDWSESHRLPAIQRHYRPWTALAPLCDPPYRDKADLIREAAEAGLRPPRLYQLGFPHNNCAGACVRAGHATWAHLLRTFPDRFAEAERNETALRAELGTTATILRDRAGGTVRPLPLAEFRRRVLGGQADAEELAHDWGGCGCLPTEDTSEPAD
jgi:hypothetical protein